MAESYKKKSYVPKEKKTTQKKQAEKKTYKVILVKENVLILSLDGNGYEVKKTKEYAKKKIGDKIVM